MRSDKLKNLYIFIFLALISVTLSLRRLATIKIVEISQALSDGIIYGKYELEPSADSFFSYDLSKSSTEKNLVITIRKDDYSDISIDCIISKAATEDDVINEFNNPKSICSVYKFKNENIIKQSFTIINVVARISNYEAGSKLYLKLNGKTKLVQFFIRKTGSYKTEIDSVDVSSAYAYQAYEFDYKSYNSKLNGAQHLLTSSGKDQILIYGERNNEISQIDDTSAFVFSEQSFASHFYHFDKVVFFFGIKEYDEKATSNNVKITLTKVTDKSNKLYYYTSESIFQLFLSFFYECGDETTNHYLITNYGNLDDKEYYYKFHGSVGAKSSVANFPPGKTDVTSLSYSEEKRFNTLSKTDYHIHVHKLTCSKNEKIVSNIKYSNKQLNSDTGNVNYIFTSDFTYKFGDKPLTLKYHMVKGYEIAIEIYTPSTEATKTFKATFEGKSYTINNQYPTVFKITDISKYNSMTIETSDSIDAIVSSSPSIEKNDNPNTPKYLVLNNFGLDEIFFTFYEVEHEFDTNYYVDLEVNNPTKETLPICFYLSTTSSVRNDAQNCFLLEASKVKNITFNPIMREAKTDNFNLTEPKYHVVIYNSLPTTDYVIQKVYFRTDLPKSTPIDKEFKNHLFRYLEVNLEKDKPSYFNIDILSILTKGEESHFDVYLLNDTSKNTEVKFELRCISEYEVAIKFLEPYFNDANNLCKLVNKDEVNSNVYHYIFGTNTVDLNDKLVIKITPKEDMTVRFAIRTDGFKIVVDGLDFKEKVLNTINEPSLFRIYQINKTSIEALDSKYSYLVFDQDINGLKLYARTSNDFIPLDKGSVVNFNAKDLSSKYKDYDKFLLVIGKNDCNGAYCESGSFFQVNKIENLFYYSTSEFKENFRVPLNIKRCRESVYYYLVYNYGKEYLKDRMFLGKYVMTGTVSKDYAFVTDKYYDEKFDTNVRAKLVDLQELIDNKQHFNFAKFRCTGGLNAYFDYFAYTDYSKKEIQLTPGSIRYFIVKNNTNLTFNYKNINDTKIEVNGTIKPIIYFEKQSKELNADKKVQLTRTTTDTNLFYVAAPEAGEIPIRVITLLNVSSLPKSGIDDNLYKIDNKFVYEIPDKAVNVTFYIKRLKSTLRLLAEDKGMEMCYNAGNQPVLDETSGNCFNVKDDYQFKYDVPNDDSKQYLVMYPTDNNEKYTIEKVEPFISDDGREAEESQEDTGEGEEDEGTSGWVIALIIIIILIVLILIGVFIFICMRKKRVTSDDIEKDNKSAEGGDAPNKRPSLDAIN